MTKPLEGVTILDLSRAVAGPYCGMLLGDIGADVIKVETPGTGDESRQYTPSYGADSCYFLATNRNKRSITLDLKSPRGIEVLERLLEKSDVLIENFRPQAARRLGLTYEALQQRYPRLIHCSITGFGPTGPMSERPAMDALIQAYSGAMSITGEPDGPPSRIGIAVADLGTGLFATYGIQAALAARAITGRGQKVETSLMESLVALCSYHHAIYWGSGEAPQRLGSAHAGMAPLQVFAVADGYLQIMAGNQKNWAALCEALEMPELKRDPRFVTNADRVANKPALHAIIGDILRRRSRAEWAERLSAADVMFAPVNGIDDALEEQQVRHRDMVIERPHPALGAMKFTGFAVKFSDTPATFAIDPPRVGQHTDEILAELGFDATAIGTLRESGAV